MEEAGVEVAAGVEGGDRETLQRVYNEILSSRLITYSVAM